ncbi:MAG: hypothetical protein IPH07_37320 [Deltaproteobacteria bacterium]|nr:hypothetical protein [Deltaproteobacteria bacterium]MBK8713485.1 hypothetical protein [Deltaproteobacteria bacterium]MBP7288111.1 hypothetical protein [Nannocystaceae bacterium]
MRDETPPDPSALAVPESAAVDPYERTYMAGQGVVLHRDKRPAPKWMQLLLGSTALAGVALLFTAAWASGLVMIPVGVVLWALFSVLRVSVSEGAVSIQYGLFGPTIPTAAIESAEAVDYDWKRFGGLGIRREMYNMPGDHGRAVRIVWRGGTKRRVTLVGTPHPEAAVAAIERARRGLPPARSATAGELGPPRDEG